MKYYYYGSQIEKNELEEKPVTVQRETIEKIPGLIIEEDTIYEIDEECLRCKRRGQNVK